MTDVGTDREKLGTLLESLGYDVERDSEKGLRITTSGVHVTVVVYGDGSLSLVCSVAGGDGVELRLEEVNEANNRVRFAKFSVHDDTLVLEADFVFSLGAPAAKENLRQIMQVWKLALLELRHLVKELVE